jgi:hypothetical protein
MLEREKKVVEAQLGQMECGKGVSFWLKPILHSTLMSKFAKNHSFIIVRPCGFCNRS